MTKLHENHLGSKYVRVKSIHVILGVPSYAAYARVRIFFETRVSSNLFQACQAQNFPLEGGFGQFRHIRLIITT